MHELSIAEAVTRIAVEHAGGRRVTRVELRVGHLRQVVPSALTFAFELTAAGTPLEGAELVIEDVPVLARCRACATESEQDGFPLACPACQTFDLEILRGEELLVEALEVESEPEPALTTSDGRTYGR